MRGSYLKMIILGTLEYEEQLKRSTTQSISGLISLLQPCSRDAPALGPSKVSTIFEILVGY